ncbi:MAG: hypothetical protein IIZ15_01265 [Coriobacteriales bacterium]|nr:hypothetical protein [Coriobacteriales bacterium]
MRRTEDVAGLLMAVLVGLLIGIVVIVASPPVSDPVKVSELLVINDKAAPETIAREAESVAEASLEEEAEEYPSWDYYPSYSYNSYWYESDDAEAEAAAKEWIAWRESGGDYNSRNGQYIGRYQLNEMYLDGDYSEENQEVAAEAYIADRYGSWQAAQEHWEAYGWY